MLRGRWAIGSGAFISGLYFAGQDIEGEPV